MSLQEDGMPPVSLVSAVAGMTRTGGGAYAWSAQVEVDVANLGPTKAVGVWGHRPLDGTWRLYPGTFVRALPGGRELWRVHLVGHPVDRFALRCDVPGVAVHWDNDGGADYRLDAAEAERHDGIGTAALRRPLRVAGWSLERVGLVVDVLVAGPAEDATVGVHYTLTEPAGWSDVTGQRQRTLPPEGTSLWRVTVPMGAGVSGRFAAYVTAGGVTDWDNDFERDFRF
jgi:hypothetical protein